MDTLERAIDFLAAPPRLFALAAVLFLLSRSARRPWTRTGGIALLAVVLGLVALLVNDPIGRRMLLHSERLPVVILLLSTLGVLWYEMHRLQIFDPTPPPRTSRTWYGFSTADLLTATALGLALVACAALFPVSLGGLADPAARPALVKAPWFLVGLQELRLDFEPVIAYRVFPLLFVAGLLALPWLRLDADPENRRLRALFLCGWLFLWLWPMTVGALLRGPQWSAFGPFQPWEAEPPPLAPLPIPLAQLFWSWIGVFEPSRWWLRELPGLLLLTSYFFLLPRALAHWGFTAGLVAQYREALGFWRFHTATLGLLALLTVPLKMIGRWLLGIGAWLNLPELDLIF